MKAILVGKAPMEFIAQDTGEVVKGVRLYYYAPKDEVQGYFAGEIFIRESAMLYNKVLGMQLERPTVANLVYDVQPGKRARVVLSDVELLPNEKDLRPAG